MRKLTSRAVLVTCLVALVSVLVTALVAAPLALRATNRATREGLADQADLTAALINTRPRPSGEDRVVQQLRTRGFTVYLVVDRTLTTPGTVPQRLVTAIGAGRAVRNQSAVIDGRLMLVEGRPLPGKPGSGILLAHSAVTGLGGGFALLRGLWWALLAGLAAGAVVGAPAARAPRRGRGAGAGAERARRGAGHERGPATRLPAVRLARAAHAVDDHQGVRGGAVRRGHRARWSTAGRQDRPDRGGEPRPAGRRPARPRPAGRGRLPREHPAGRPRRRAQRRGPRVDRPVPGAARRATARAGRRTHRPGADPAGRGRADGQRAPGGTRGRAGRARGTAGGCGRVRERGGP